MFAALHRGQESFGRRYSIISSSSEHDFGPPDLRKLLAGSRIEIEDFGEGRERRYTVRGELSIGKLISGATTNTSHCGGPDGIWQWDVFPKPASAENYSGSMCFPVIRQVDAEIAREKDAVDLY